MKGYNLISDTNVKEKFARNWLSNQYEDLPKG